MLNNNSVGWLVKLLISLSFVACSIHMAVASQAEDTGVTLIYPENEAVDLGMGWNLHKNKSVPNVCIKNFATYDVQKNEKEESFHEGNNSFSLKESLDISYSESVSEEAKGMGAEEHASESGEMSMAQSFDEKNDDRYVLANQHIITKWSAIKSSSGDLIELTDSAKSLLETDPDAFHEQCGHGYVARVEYGGAFHALFNMHKSSYTSAVSFKASFQDSAGASDNAGVGSGSASESSSGSISEDLSSSVSSQHIDITVLETGGEPSSAGTNIQSVLQQYASFPKRAASEPSEFRLVVFPYPKSNGLAESQGPLMALGREYGKWEYLDRTIGKMIVDEHTGKDSRFTEISGVTASAEDLAYMQNMAQAKLDVIASVAASCMKLIQQDKSGTSVTQSEFNKACSLKGRQVDFKVKNKKSGKYQVDKVDVAESDIYYLVRLPFQHKVFDGLLKVEANKSGKYSYQDLIFNQVMGIYKERCGNKEIPRFCENEAKTEQAVKNYVSSANGRLYFKFQTRGGSRSLCMANRLSGNTTSTVQRCDDEDYQFLFAFDHDNKVMRMADNNNKPNGCLHFANRGHSEQMYYFKSTCPTETTPQNYLAYFELLNGSDKQPSVFQMIDINTKAYASWKDNYCLWVNNRKDKAGTWLLSWKCQTEQQIKKDPTGQFGMWKLIEPRFILDEN